MDWVVKGWTPMYTFWLGLGLTYLISGLVRAFCKLLMITPSYLNPNSLHILLAVDQKNEKYLGLSFLSGIYSMRTLR